MRFPLAAFWFIYMGSMGIFFPFYGLYLQQTLGFSGTQVGAILAVLPTVGLLAQPFWGQLADRTGSRRAVLAGVTLGVALAYAVLGRLSGFLPVLFGTAFLAAFSPAVLPLLTAVTLATLSSQRGAWGFGAIRMWGTLGFLALVISFPHLLPALGRLTADGPWNGLASMFLCCSALALVASWTALLLPPGAALQIRAAAGDVRKLLAHRPMVRLLVGALVTHSFMQGPVLFFPLFITARGGDLATLSQMWIFMILLEVPLVGFSSRTLKWLGPRGLLTLGLAAEGIRWTTSALLTDLDAIRWVQLLHGVGVAGVLIGAPLYLELAVPARLRATGQALVAVSVGAGTLLSTAAGGWLLDHVGTSAPYALAGAALSLLALLVFRVLPEPSHPDG